MRSCPACGAPVADTDEFCGNCGTYLGWSRERGAPGPGVEEAAGAVPDQPVAVQPARPHPPRLAPSVSTEPPVEHGPRCWSCGTPNPQGRRFCRHCAAALVRTDRTVERMPWWRRLRLPGRRGGSGVLARRLVLLFVVLALVVAAVLLVPQGKGLYDYVLDKTSTPAPIGAQDVVASAEVPGHPAAAAVDGLSNRYWGAPKPGAWLEVTFDRPFRLLSLVVHAGPAAKRDGFAEQARPAGLDVIVTSQDGSTRTVSAELADQPGPQNVDAAVSDVVRIRLIVRSAAGLSAGKHIAVGEVEFFRRS